MNPLMMTKLVKTFQDDRLRDADQQRLFKSGLDSESAERKKNIEMVIALSGLVGTFIGWLIVMG